MIDYTKIQNGADSAKNWKKKQAPKGGLDTLRRCYEYVLLNLYKKKQRFVNPYFYREIERERIVWWIDEILTECNVEEKPILLRHDKYFVKKKEWSLGFLNEIIRINERRN